MKLFDIFRREPETEEALEKIDRRYWEDRRKTEFTHKMPVDEYPRIFTIDGTVRLVDGGVRLLLFEPLMEANRLGRYYGYMRPEQARAFANKILEWCDEHD